MVHNRYHQFSSTNLEWEVERHENNVRFEVEPAPANSGARLPAK
jgi:hypothetical protein